VLPDSAVKARRAVSPARKSLRENLLDKTMGAPGLAFETWDPLRKCWQTKLENSNFEKARGTDATRSNSHAHSKAQMECP
jgi:hypothetical protein